MAKIGDRCYINYLGKVKKVTSNNLKEEPLPVIYLGKIVKTTKIEREMNG